MERKFNYLAEMYKEEGARFKFEDICADIISNIYKFQGVYKVRISRGDGGVDVFHGDIDKSVEVYQCKYFLGKLDQSRKQQIKKSFNTAKNRLGHKMKTWTLCISCDLSLEEYEWWRKFVNENKIYCSNIDLKTEENLLNLMKEFNIYDKYFNTVTIDKDFFYSKKSPSRLQEINENFSPIINYISKVQYYTNLQNIDYIEKIINKYKGDYLFINNSIIDNLECLTYLISFNSGFIKEKEQEEKYKEIAIEILKEYNLLINSLRNEV